MFKCSKGLELKNSNSYIMPQPIWPILPYSPHFCQMQYAISFNLLNIEGRCNPSIVGSFSKKRQFFWRVLTISAVLPLLYLNQSIIYLFSKEKTIIDKYNKLKLNKTNKILRNNLAYYLL